MSLILEGFTPSKDEMMAYDPEIRCLMARRSSLEIKDGILLIIVNILLTRWIMYHGVPSQIISDQGKEFEGHQFRHLGKLLYEFTKLCTSPYCPQTDGQVERFNRKLLNMFSAFVSDSGTNWDMYVLYMTMAYRSSIHDSTGCAPNLMVYG